MFANENVKENFSRDVESLVRMYLLDELFQMNDTLIAATIVSVMEELHNFCDLRATCIEARKDADTLTLEQLRKAYSSCYNSIGQEKVDEIVLRYIDPPEYYTMKGLSAISPEKREEVIAAFNTAIGKHGSYDPPAKTEGYYCDACCAEGVQEGEVKPCRNRSFVYEDDGGVCSRCGLPADVFAHPDMAAFTAKFPKDPPATDFNPEYFCSDCVLQASHDPKFRDHVHIHWDKAIDDAKTVCHGCGKVAPLRFVEGMREWTGGLLRRSSPKRSAE